MKGSAASATGPPSRRVTGPRWITTSNGLTSISSAVSRTLSKREGCNMNDRLYAIIVTTVCCMAAASAAQQTGPGNAAPNPQTPTFRLQVEYVEVDVRVTD